MSQDPQWGRGGQGGGRGGGGEGPPDLDELWRDFNRRINTLFGKRSPRGAGDGGNDPSGTPPSMRGAGIGAGVIAVGALVLWLGSGFYIVPEGQSAAVLQFGEFKYLTDKAGFKWRLPGPIQSHEMVNLQELKQVTVGFRGDKGGDTRDSLMLTADENMVDLQFAVQYRINDAKAFLFNNRNPIEAVTQVAETAMREVVGRSNSDSVLYENKEAVARDARQTMQKIIDRYHAGFFIVDVTIQNVQPPEEVQDAFNDAVKAGQDAERAKNEGQAYANDVIPKARGLAERLKAESEGYREKIVAQATGDAARFKSVLAEYSKAPAVTRDRMYIETMQTILSNSTKVMVDSKNNANLLNLPLDKLMAQAAAEAAGRQASAGQTGAANVNETTVTPETSKATRDTSLRSREREGR